MPEGPRKRKQRLLAARTFQPWEGGEGQALGQHGRTHVLLGRSALARGDAGSARKVFSAALDSPRNLGEAKHLLANQSDLLFWLGETAAALGEPAVARQHWVTAANFKGDFQEMSVRAFSEMTYYSALSLARLGRRAASLKLLRELRAYAKRLARTPAKIDYFATSLPTMLVFDDNLPKRQLITATFLHAQASLGLGQVGEARKLLTKVLRLDPNHALAADLRGSLPLAPAPLAHDYPNPVEYFQPQGRLPDRLHHANLFCGGHGWPAFWLRLGRHWRRQAIF